MKNLLIFLGSIKAESLRIFRLGLAEPRPFFDIIIILLLYLYASNYFKKDFCVQKKMPVFFYMEPANHDPCSIRLAYHCTPLGAISVALWDRRAR